MYLRKVIYFLLIALVISSCEKLKDCDESFKLTDSMLANAKANKTISFKAIKLQNLPCELFELDELEELDLFNTDLKSLTSDIGKLDNLKRLNLSWNEISSFPTELFELKKLEILTIYGAPKEDLELPNINGIKKLNKLKELDLSSYTFKILPKEILEIKSLEKLNLSAVGLTKIPDEIGNLINLKKLSIQVNPEIVELPESMKRLINLKELWMSGTGVYQSDVNELSKALPNCEIHFSPNYGKE
ncbi:leucine-rich repeat domain-containing protein [Winogradskyella forsetii]|uniref:leucine-rich repeat domain-containing protein n=1 Tax=Winogradskyella forsetii TaxID=2686077 RepID=UPI0015BE361F|nr:leucine-rich repeat domain-containing protein [Winogradskyella forsetii]